VGQPDDAVLTNNEKIFTDLLAEYQVPGFASAFH
jgi:hypothetical protein